MARKRPVLGPPQVVRDKVLGSLPVIAEFCRRDPSRLHAVGLVPLQSAELAIEEAQRREDLKRLVQDVGRLRELERRRLEQVLFDTEKLAATGRLAASIAHEINNPLEAVQNSLYLLSRAVPEGVAERSYLDIATRETQRMSRILRQMLGFYRPAKSMAPTDVNALVLEAETLVAKRLRERGPDRIGIGRETVPGSAHVV